MNGIEHLLEDREIPLQDRLLRDSVALFGKWMWKDTLEGTKDAFVMANTHLFWDPAHSDVKLVQAHAIRRALQSFNAEDQLPIFFCGDFNSVPGSLVYNYLREHFYSAYANYDTEGRGEPQCTNVNGVKNHDTAAPNGMCGGTYAFADTLDYIFHCARSLPIQLQDLVTLEEATTEVALPNSKYGSDHFPLLSEFSVCYL